MADSQEPKLTNTSGPIAFQTEIKQLLNILVHSLYTKKEIFLRELLSNASDALTQMRFIQQTDHKILDPSLELEIRIELDSDRKVLKISDTGIGMTSEEMKTNLGTIAQSGARAFLDAADGDEKDLVDVIGRFGVGFYSVFMAAEWVKVSSRSYQPEEEAASWFATGADTFEMGTSEKETRGTVIEVKMKEDAQEFLDKYRLREIIKTHSDYVPFPIYLADEKEQINQQNAIWRENPRAVEEDQYQEFYRQLTLEMEPPLEKIHFIADAPLMIYSLLYLPSKPDRGLFTLREQDGLKLYARKILIENYAKDLLPPYFRFIQGVVDAEDLPLNVSRESVQATAVVNRIKKILTNQVIQKLKEIAAKDPETYKKFWPEFGQFIKEGVAANDEYREELSTLLRFHSTTIPDQWSSLDDYLEHLKPGQEKIYYILGDDESSVSRSPHLDYFQTHCYEVLTLTDPVDSFMLLGLREYKEFTLQNVAASDLTFPDQDKVESEIKAEPSSLLSEEHLDKLLKTFHDILGERITEVRLTDRLTNSVARLVDAKGSLGQEMQRVYRMMDREYKAPKKILEINPGHPILKELSKLPAENPLTTLIVEQIFESTLLIEGLHPDPASMIPRIQQLMELALNQE
ncbi:MAG: molecular chaperone HtpG [Anaerolineales bacterium]|nr:MAG: molecular chaperone HtpG [Anaerolineales bacterium]